MSRSYKKSPVFVYNLDESKNIKRIFNRRLRHKWLENYKEKGIYRKMNRSWMIHEIKDYCSYGKYLYCTGNDELNMSENESKKISRNEWEKIYIRK